MSDNNYLYPNFTDDINILTNESLSYLNVKSYNKKIKTLVDMHYQLELGIVYSGKMKRFYQDDNIELTSGNIWINNMWEPHSFEIVETPCKVLIFGINPATLNSFYLGEDVNLNLMSLFTTPIQNRINIVSKVDKSKLLDLANTYDKIINSKAKLSKQLERSIILGLLTFIYTNCDSKKLDKIQISTEYSRINKAIEMVLNSKKFIPSNEAAKSCAMNITMFNSLFKNLMGVSFSQFALVHRIKGAATLLKNTDTPIKEIVYEWGFADSSHFYRSFKKIYGCNPNVYRREFQII